MQDNNCAVVLAAGEGKRMLSSRPKVLSPVLFKPMLQWVLDSAAGTVADICVVTGHLHEEVEAYLAKNAPEVSSVYQEERRGTGHAVMVARSFLLEHRGGNVLILNGDAPFVSEKVIAYALADHTHNNNAVTVVSAVVKNPTGYGRIVRDEATHLLSAIVEQKDADPETLDLREINSGAYWFSVNALLDILDDIKADNAQGEYYLTDAVKLLIARGRKADAHTTSNPAAVLGANDCAQLAVLNSAARDDILQKHMKKGVEFPCKDGVMIGPDVVIGSDTCVLPGTILRGKTKIGNGCTLGPHTTLTDCTVGSGCTLSYVQGTAVNVAPKTSSAPFTVL